MTPKLDGTPTDEATDALTLDVVPFGYLYDARRDATENPPETRWLTEGRDDVLYGVMWEEHRPARRVEIRFDGPAPKLDGLLLEATTHAPDAMQTNRPTWWTRRWETFPGEAVLSDDGRTVIYETDPAQIAERLKAYPPEFQHEPDPHGLIFVNKLRLRFAGETSGAPGVESMRVTGESRLTPMTLEIEWGFADRTEEGGERVIEIYNGRLVSAKPLEGSGRKGVVAEILYVSEDEQEMRFKEVVFLPVGRGGRLSYHPNRTVVTVKSDEDGFSFSPKDLETEEAIYSPSLGFFATKAGSGLDAESFARRIAEEGRKTVRERVREMPERGLSAVLTDHYGADRPPIPEAEDEPPMTIDVPDDLAMKAWKLAFWHVKRHCIEKDGDYLIYIWPYLSLLGQESWRIFAALDLLGEHAISRSGFKPWFEHQGKCVALGMFSDQDGALNVPGWDLNHAQGHGSMLYAMALHHALTGDRDWLRAHQENFVSACEWIVRQRAFWSEKVGAESGSFGLMPPCEMGDYADWRSLYQTNVFYWRGLKAAGEALSELSPEIGAKYLREAEEFRLSIAKAAKRSALFAPAMKAGDGTYKRFIPPHPYLRGSAEVFANPYSGGHAGSLVMDTECGAAALGLGVLPPDDPDLGDFLDVLEDRLYLENWVVRMHAEKRRGNRPDSWISAGGYYYQCGYSQTALAHLRRDDVPNYLRATFNQYAAVVDPEKAYQFREHPNRTGEGDGGDKTFETSAFLERMRAMFATEEGDRLWLAKATPREWLRSGKRIAVKDAPTTFGVASYEIVSEADRGRIVAEVEIQARRPLSAVMLRLRHPDGVPMKSVRVNGVPHADFDPAKECIALADLKGALRIEAEY